MLLGAGPIADLPFGVDRNPSTLRFGAASLVGNAQMTVAETRVRLMSGLELGNASITSNLTRVRPLSAMLAAGATIGAALSAVQIPFLRLIADPSARRVYVAEFTIRRFK